LIEKINIGKVNFKFLWAALWWGHVEMVEYLLNQGADPNKAGASWATPLSRAKRKGHIEVEKILVKAGAT